MISGVRKHSEAVVLGGKHADQKERGGDRLNSGEEREPSKVTAKAKQRIRQKNQPSSRGDEFGKKRSVGL